MAGAVAPVAIALGSNLGDRLAHLQFGVGRLAEFLAGLRVSSFRETLPQGVEPQPLFLNGVAVGSTDLAPDDLLRRLLAIERDGGRERPWPGAARTLDLDLILYDALVLDTAFLTLPHPRFRERRFVLEPLAEVAPEMVDPISGCTVRELLDRLPAAS